MTILVGDGMIILSKFIATRSMVWYGTKWDAICCCIFSLIFVFLYSMVFRVGQLGSVMVVLPIELRIATYDDDEATIFSGSSKVT